MTVSTGLSGLTTMVAITHPASPFVSPTYWVDGGTEMASGNSFEGPGERSQFPEAPQSSPSANVTWPDFGSPRLNTQLRNYWRYVKTLGQPDVLIVGSSRALQGIDPHVLSHELSRQGHGKLRVYNFGINGATAQVVTWLLVELLGRDRLPPLILWANGSRAFNNGRPDRTFASIANSPGYQQLRQGWRPPWSPIQIPSRAIAPLSIFPPVELSVEGVLRRDRPGSLRAIRQSRQFGQLEQSDLTFNGFLRDEQQFHPPSYYKKFPKVAGEFDSSYVPFQLWDGLQQQSIYTLTQHLIQHSDAPKLVLINLPLSSDFLDDARRDYEQQFRQFMGTQQRQTPWLLRDYLDLWPTQNHYFADPSHINFWGAATLSRHLAGDPNIPWPQSR